MGDDIAVACGLVVPQGTIIEGQRLYGGVQIVFVFPNHRGASVVRHAFSYGGSEGYFELAVLDRHMKLDYTTPITADVLGYLRPHEVDSYLAQIAALPDEEDR